MKGQQVHGVGGYDTDLILIGEAPGRDEEASGIPFVGYAGRLQEEFGWHPVGLRRSEFRIDNVVQVRPRGNEFTVFSPGFVESWVEDLHVRLALHARSAVIVPVGNVALNAIRRNPVPMKDATHWRLKNGLVDWKDRIGSWRGSIFRYVDNDGRTHKVIPTIHPAALHQNPLAFPDWQGDWARIAVERSRPTRFPKEGTDRLARTRKDLVELKGLAKQAHLLALDIETDGHTILCIGFAWSRLEAMTVPLVPSKEQGWDQRFIAMCWAVVKEVLGYPVPKVTHNGLFDTYHLAIRGLPVRRWWWDTAGMHHQINPNQRHSLAYCASKDIRTYFWKDEAKEMAVGPRGGVQKRWRRNLAELMAYCGKDCRHTWGLQQVYQERLGQLGMLPTYVDHHRRMNWACLEMSLTGVPIDQEARQVHAQHWEAEKAKLKVALKAVSGMELVATKSLSSTKVLSYFYEVLACRPIRKKGQSAGLTANEVAIRRLMLRYKKARDVGQLILDYRHAQKMSEFVAETRVDADGRLRSLYRPLTKSGRLMASKTPIGTGTNLQNQPHKIRNIFVAARPDWLLGSLDLSQAESRIVDGSSSDPRGLELARTPPEDLDQHALMASEVLEKAIGEVTQEERQVVGKKGRHATNYGEGGAMMSDTLLTETESEVVRTPEECQDIIDAIMEKRPYIAVWQWWVKGLGIKGRVLTNSWGCRYVTPWWGVVEKDYKEWLAWGPQSEVTKLLDQCGWLPARQLIRAGRLDVEIVMQNHDELVFHGPPEQLFGVMESVAHLLSAEREYPGVEGVWTLAMPVGWSVGKNFRDMKKWKGTPTWDGWMGRCEKLLG